MGFVSTCLRIAKRRMRKKIKTQKRASTIRLIKSEFSVLYAHVRTCLRYRQPGHTVWIEVIIIGEDGPLVYSGNSVITFQIWKIVSKCLHILFVHQRSNYVIDQLTNSQQVLPRASIHEGLYDLVFYECRLGSTQSVRPFVQMFFM